MKQSNSSEMVWRGLIETLATRQFWLFLLGLLAISVVVYGAILMAANRFYVPPKISSGAIQRAPNSSRTGGDKLTIITWNIGYAGMGKEADFVMDGGQQRRPESKELVQRNLTAVAKFLAEHPADVYFLQEVAQASWNTYRIDTLARMKKVLNEYGSAFGADVKTRYVPPPLRVCVGNAIFSRCRLRAYDRLALPLEPQFQAGMFRKAYRMHVVRLPLADERGEWVLVNIHLAAFDEAAAIRQRQLSAIADFAIREFERGNLVIVGGDWNLRLARTNFPHRTDKRHLFWVHDLPVNIFPAGWKVQADSRVPSVRTAHQPYVEGDNYVCIIDGFICSPNVVVHDVRTYDLGFSNTDHHPVLIRVQALPPTSMDSNSLLE